MGILFLYWRASQILIGFWDHQILMKCTNSQSNFSCLLLNRSVHKKTEMQTRFKLAFAYTWENLNPDSRMGFTDRIQ